MTSQGVLSVHPTPLEVQEFSAEVNSARTLDFPTLTLI